MANAPQNQLTALQRDLFAKAKVLIVDDNVANVRYLERILRGAGLRQLRSTTQPQEVLALFSAIDPDLVVLDLMMPELDGYQLMEQLRPLIAAGTYMPILVITADITPEARRRALAGGARDFLTKPFDPIEIVLRISNLLEIRSLYRELQNRIGRDIHDGPLQDLSALLLRTELLEQEIASGDAAQALAALGQLRRDMAEMMTVLRGLVQDLRPPVLDTLGLGAALDYLTMRLRRETGIIARLDNRLAARLDPVQETVLFRLVQESLNNIRQHSQASHAWVVIEERPDGIHVAVRDDGHGFAVEESTRAAIIAGHAGLAGMQERARVAGGELTIDSAAGQGTTVSMVFPFNHA